MDIFIVAQMGTVASMVQNKKGGPQLDTQWTAYFHFKVMNYLHGTKYWQNNVNFECV